MTRCPGRLHTLSLGLTVCLFATLARGEGAVPTASLGAAAPYVASVPIRIYRFHVYSTMKQRWKKTVTVESLVSTSQGGVAVGDEGLLQRRLDAAPGGDEWAPVAKVVVKKLLSKGRLELQIESEESDAAVKRHGKLPFSPGEKVRLQIDRVMRTAD